MHRQIVDIYCMCIIKPILTKYDRPAVVGKIQSTFSTVFSTHAIGRIIMQSEFMIKILAPQHVLPWKHYTAPKTAKKRITKKNHLSKFFDKIQFNLTYCNLI